MESYLNYALAALPGAPAPAGSGLASLWLALGAPAFLPASFAALFLIAAMFAGTLRRARWLALIGGVLGLVFFAAAGSAFGQFWTALFAAATGVSLILARTRDRQGAMGRDERQLMEDVLRVQDPRGQARLRDLIAWRDAAAGEVLMRQGQVAPPLIYVASGRARIEVDGRTVGTCGGGDFLGEMSIVSGDTASASAIVAEPARIARFDREALLRLATAMPELSRAFDHALNRGLAAKVARMNAASARSETGSDAEG